MEEAVLEFRHVFLTLGERRVLQDLSFRVEPGETRVILGASGSGKTTILKLILGLHKPDHGAILVNGQDITPLTERELRRHREDMAMVFQNAALFDSLSVRDNVGYRLWERGSMTDAVVERVVENSLRFVGLEDTLDKMPAELSGGMRKRVGIARALASGARLLLYDEPTAGLDPLNNCLINRLILRLKSKGVTQIVVTHDLESAYRVADRVILIMGGRTTFEGTTPALRSSSDLAVRAFIDPTADCGDAEAVLPALEAGVPLDG